jgi:hypothetical protein
MKKNHPSREAREISCVCNLQPCFNKFLHPMTSRFVQAGVAVGLVLTTILAVETPQSSQSFFGNSFPGEVWIQNNVQALAVAADGLIFTNSGWDEAGREAGIYREGRPVGMFEGLHGWGRRGGPGIALADGFVFLAMSQAGGYKYPEDDFRGPVAAGVPPGSSAADGTEVDR